MAAALIWCLVLLSLGVGERGVIFPLAAKATCTGISPGAVLAVEVLLLWVWHSTQLT